MKRIILINGLIAGAITSAMFFVNYPLLISGTMDLDTGTVIGYTSMVIALSVIFFGIKTYRDQYTNGSISFWSGLKIGLLITLVASVMYATVWEVFSIFAPVDFSTFYAEQYVKELREDGASAAEINAVVAEMAEFKIWYQNPLLRFSMTLMEILPVGIIISIIAAGILRKKEALPA